MFFQHCHAHCHCHARLDSKILWVAERMGDKAKDIADCQRLLLSDTAIGQPPKGKGKGVPQLETLMATDCGVWLAQRLQVAGWRLAKVN